MASGANRNKNLEDDVDDSDGIVMQEGGEAVRNKNLEDDIYDSDGSNLL